MKFLPHKKTTLVKRKLFLGFLFIFLFSLENMMFVNLQASEKVKSETQRKHGILKGGWYYWDPYQYLKTPGDNTSLTGLDVELQKLILKQAGYGVDISSVLWNQHQDDIKNGVRDFAAGAFYSKERAEYAYFPVPYRYEEDALFLKKSDLPKYDFSNVDGFLQTVKEKKLKIGIVDGYRYADDKINAFIQDPETERFLVKSDDDNINLNLLVADKIDAFLSDRIVGATLVWRQKVGRIIGEKLLNAKAPIYMMLSKKAISEQVFNTINEATKKVVNSPEYAKTVSWYLYPTLLLATTDSEWFVIIEIIGIAAFALSGLVVAYRHNATLFGTFILALLPSFGGGVLRDVVFGRYPVWFIQARFYIFLVLFIVIIGFFSVKIYQKWGGAFKRLFPKRAASTLKLFDTVLVITDAIGLAAFTVTGVLVSMIVKADPLWIWGPFFAFLTGAGGGMLRDMVVKETRVGAISGDIYPEIAIFWGFVLSMYLTYSAYDINPGNIEMAVFLTIICAFITRLCIYFFKISNLYMNQLQPKNKE